MYKAEKKYDTAMQYLVQTEATPTRRTGIEKSLGQSNKC
jgi:hypothetical protein